VILRALLADLRLVQEQRQSMLRLRESIAPDLFAGIVRKQDAARRHIAFVLWNDYSASENDSTFGEAA
jgi:hypothetical protein